jgi:hypothetical protein
MATTMTTAQWYSREMTPLDWVAGYSDVTTRVTAGPGRPDAWFTVTRGERSVVFQGRAQLVWALMLADGPVTWDMPIGRVLALLLDGPPVTEYAARAAQDPGALSCPARRSQQCATVAARLIALTSEPDACASNPQWLPDWREDRSPARSGVVGGGWVNTRHQAWGL